MKLFLFTQIYSWQLKVSNRFRTGLEIGGNIKKTVGLVCSSNNSSSFFSRQWTKIRLKFKQYRIFIICLTSNTSTLKKCWRIFYQNQSQCLNTIFWTVEEETDFHLLSFFCLTSNTSILKKSWKILIRIKVNVWTQFFGKLKGRLICTYSHSYSHNIYRYREGTGSWIWSCEIKQRWEKFSKDKRDNFTNTGLIDSDEDYVKQW